MCLRGTRCAAAVVECGLWVGSDKDRGEILAAQDNVGTEIPDSPWRSPAPAAFNHRLPSTHHPPTLDPPTRLDDGRRSWA